MCLKSGYLYSYLNNFRGYRFSFNGQEKDDEVAGVGNIMTAEFWEYDTRLGRRWNLDPVIKQDFSGYGVLGDNPIVFFDENGDDWYKDQAGNVKYFDNTSAGFSDLNKQSWTNIGSTKTAPDQLIEGIKNGSIENRFHRSFILNEKKYYNAIYTCNGNSVHTLAEIDRPYDVTNGEYLPRTIKTLDEDGVPLTIKVSFGPGFASDNFHTPNNKIAPYAVEGFIEGMMQANQDGACVNEVTIGATTNGHHHNAMKGVNWHKSPSTHYPLKGGGRAIDIGNFNRQRISNKSTVSKTVQLAFLKVNNIYEVYGPHINNKDGKTIGNQQHNTWIHVSFKKKL